ncbi:MAG TPA: hypothetical protein VFQ61_19040 [Polyangiaceae bacterium]|nr:hypothetical protein [Polyangiaceae bacterium]
MRSLAILTAFAAACVTPPAPNGLELPAVPRQNCAGCQGTDDTSASARDLRFTRTAISISPMSMPSRHSAAKGGGASHVLHGAMAQIKSAMVAGADKNIYVEPIIGTVEYARKKYKYPQERSN